jgi:hypothetical protein
MMWFFFPVYEGFLGGAGLTDLRRHNSLSTRLAYASSIHLTTRKNSSKLKWLADSKFKRVGNETRAYNAKLSENQEQRFGNEARFFGV